MRVLITGNMGYIGPVLVRHLRNVFPQIEIIGYDIGYFADCLTGTGYFPEVLVDRQVFGDVRKFPAQLLDGVDTVINLAAISNDPMGKKFEEVTMDVNYRACVEIATMAKSAGVRSFVFASSCSMYGAADDYPKTEESAFSPLTAYAKSKVYAERDLRQLADSSFVITSLRFSTACGFSQRLRLDLVLNDFVAGAVADQKLEILSDGTPWRAMVHVKDMSRAIEWATVRETSCGGDFLAVNIGSNSWNFQIKTMAEAVTEIIPGVSLSLNKNAPADKRSYKVNFDLFSRLAPNHQPIYDLPMTVRELEAGLRTMKFSDRNFRNSDLIRLRVLNRLQEESLLNDSLAWQII
ncbi:MAG: SDR family oxidoreductase [Lunatimonas sp.]|uniref:NAD-dependent epimerase/dehydratase family protein n=1 Tax=Lunatimonas sp. TaxID=2060141 RepID=UPI00263AA302|nr:SDR family oxidoreductase [Lunatimonas sp.]MCC5937643.1 SDR family oxidoreductase [Lunatimonas sp.]